MKNFHIYKGHKKQRSYLCYKKLCKKFSGTYKCQRQKQMHKPYSSSSYLFTAKSPTNDINEFF